MKGEMNQLVRQIMETIHATKADKELAPLIAPKLGRKYANLAGSIANWRNLHDRMPAEALLAACQVMGVSIDEALFGKSLAHRLDRIEQRLADLGAEPPGDRG